MELIRTRGHLPDLVLLDVEIPDESGFKVSCFLLTFFACDCQVMFGYVQVCQQLRRLYPIGLPILMLSGNDEGEQVITGLQVVAFECSARLIQPLLDSVSGPALDSSQNLKYDIRSNGGDRMVIKYPCQPLSSQMGANDFVKKPIRCEEVIDISCQSLVFGAPRDRSPRGVARSSWHGWRRSCDSETGGSRQRWRQRGLTDCWTRWSGE